MNKLKNITGKEYGRLRVIRLTGRDKFRRALWECLCTCGKTVLVDGGSLRSGNTNSCGCYHKDKITTHGISGSSGKTGRIEYASWQGMLQRCYNENNPDFDKYGGRGITVCERWRESFENFIEDMGPAPSLKHSIDRRDNDKGYSPDNCRWATKKEQDRNKCTNHLLTYKGETRCLIEWSEITGIDASTIYHRIRRKKMTVEEAFETPVNRRVYKS